MKRSILFLLSILVSMHVVGQSRPTLHAKIFADTYDDKIGSGAEVSKQRFDYFLSTIANEINYEYDGIFYAGRDCSRQSLEKALNDFSCDTSDIVVFCYLGHGGRSFNDTSIFPQMCLHEKSQKDFVPLESVTKKLASHGARLTLVIGDCCNSYGEYITPKPIPQPGATMLPGATISLIDQLFLNTTGTITMCASKPGTYGWTNSMTGMYFNNALITAIKSVGLNSIRPGQPWQTVMDAVMKDLAANPIMKDGQSYTMEPKYRIEPRNVKKGGGVRPPLPSTLQRDLSAISNRHTHPVERTRLISPILESYFTGDGVVRTVSDDGIAYGSIYTFRQYLGRIARSENIVNILVRNAKYDTNGKITYLEVHEVYSELKK